MVSEGPEPPSRAAARRRPDVRAMCPGCGVTRHRALVLIGERVVRVECRACGGRHKVLPLPSRAHGSGAGTPAGLPVVDFDFERYARYFTRKQICDHDDRDILAPELLNRHGLDLAVASLRGVDRYLTRLAGDRALLESGNQPTNSLLTRTVLWGGAYLGEVIRRNTAAALHWIDHEDYLALHPQYRKANGPRTRMLPRYAFLCVPHGAMIDPLEAVIRCVLDVGGPGVHAYARGTLRLVA